MHDRNEAALLRAREKARRRRRRLILDDDGDDRNEAALLRAREKARRRRRRLILDDDGDQVYYVGEEASPDEFLATRYGPWLDGTPVDSVAWCMMWGIGWSRALAAESYENDPKEMSTRYWHTQMLGTPLTTRMPDPTPVVIDYCRRHEMEIFGSIRMNDTHDAFGQPFNELVYPLKVKHPEFLLGDESSRPEPRSSLAKWMWSGLDYAHPEVREDRYWWIDHTAGSYDLDGVDLNFFRWPWFFKAGEEEASMPLMTDLIRRARRRLDEIGKERGRPMLLGVRVPGTVQVCRNIGLDIETWLEEGLIDRMLTGGGLVAHSTPAEELIGLGHRHGVPVYPCISCGSCGSPEALRAAASNLWHAGADGLYLWNYHYLFMYAGTSTHLRGRPRPEDYRYLAEIGEPSRLASLDKIFAVNPPEHVLRDLWAFLRASAPVPLPLEITGGPTDPHMVPVRIGDNIQEAADRGILKSLSLGLKFERSVNQQGLEVRFNGEAVGDGIASPDDSGRIDFTLKPAIVKQGVNQLAVAMRECASVPEAGPRLVQIYVTVRYRPTA